MIYELWLWKNNPMANAAYDRRSVEEEKALEEVFNEAAMARFGAGWVLYCSCAWADETYRNWGITSYKSIEDKIEHTRAFTKAGWFRFAEIVTLMGTLDGAEPKLADFPNPIYELYVMRTNPVTAANYGSLSKEEMTELWSKWGQSMDRNGAKEVLYCKSAWSNEAFGAFGVVVFPSIEACQAHHDDIEKLHWPLYFSPFTILGIVEPAA